MDFCPKCGRQRSDGARFCAGCGTDLGEAPAGDQTRVDVPAEATRFDTPAADTPADPAMAESAPAKPADDPVAHWFAPAAPAAPAGPAAPPAPPAPAVQPPSGQWQPTETVFAGAARPGAGYPPPAQPGPVYPAGPAYRPGPGRPSGGRRAGFFLAGLLIVLAAGGGAYALVSAASKHNSGRPSASSTSHQSTTAASTPATSPATSGSASTSPTTATASPAGSPGGVALAPGVAANPAAAQAQTVLGHYFHAINTHNYAEYAAELDAGLRAAQPESSFKAGYGSTHDSGMTLTSLSTAANGTLAATVTFTSHQDPAQSVDGSSCNNWTLTLYLVQQGSGYLITHAPAGYRPDYSDC